jgi:SAM-dependent methyltransferase
MVCPDRAHAAERLLRPFARGEVDFVQCPACGLLFRETFPGSAELDAIYDAAYAEEAISAGATNQASGEYATGVYADFMLSRFLRPGMAVLDFGAGTGALVERLRSAGMRADGFEFSDPARAHCRRELGFDLIGDVSAIAPATYDVVCMIEVIEHLTDLTGTLTRLHAALRPGGRLLVTTPNRSGWRARLEGGNWREARKKFHLFLFDEASLHHHLDLAGFRAFERIRFSPVLRPGVGNWLIVRGTQLARLGGSLCAAAVRA